MPLEKLPVRGVQSSYGIRGKLPVRPTSFVSNEIYKLRSTNFQSNQLINTYPTLVVAPYSGGNTQTYTAFNSSGGSTITMAEDQIDAATGRVMAKVTIPALSSASSSIDYLDLPVFQMEPDDIWMVSCYLPNRLNGNINVRILVTDQAVFSGGNYREYIFTGDRLQQGFNLLSVLHVEDLVDSNTYGRVGTTRRTAWRNLGTNNDNSKSRSIRIQCNVIGGTANDTDIYLGSVLKAPAGWAKGAMMWMVDDTPTSFYDLALPIIESFGWKCTFAIVTTYASDPGATYMGLDEVRDVHARGHEIWSHLRRHEDMSAITTAEKTRAIKNAAQYFRANGFSTAGNFLAWPFGRFDAEAITLAKAENIKLAASIRGDEINPLIAGCNPFYLNRFTVEIENSWQIDTMLNGAIKRGQGALTYMHNAVAGGSNTDTYPGEISFYVDHLKRWCELIAQKELAGECIVTTPLEYLKLCGIDPYTDTLAE